MSQPGGMRAAPALRPLSDAYLIRNPLHIMPVNVRLATCDGRLGGYRQLLPLQQPQEAVDMDRLSDAV